MTWLGDYLVLALRWGLMVLCALSALALGLAGVVLVVLDVYDWLKRGSADIPTLTVLTGPIPWTGLEMILDFVPVWLVMLLLAWGFAWMWKQLRLRGPAGHYLMGRRHKHAARQLRRDWAARQRNAQQ